MWRPIASSTGPILGGGSSMIGWSLSTIVSIWLRWMNESPWVRGMLGFTWAITVLAASAAGLV